MKRHFQLLEVLIAAFIILICAAPALKVFTSIYTEQQEVIRENQRDHIARLIHANIIEQLYKRTIPLDHVVKEESGPIAHPGLQGVLKHWSYEGTYSFSNIRSFIKKGEEKPSKYLATLTISLKDASKKVKKIVPFTYDYEVYIDSGALAKEPKRQQINEDDTNDDNQAFEEAQDTIDGSPQKDPFQKPKNIKGGDL